MCPLCGHESRAFFRDERTLQTYERCPECALCFLVPRLRLSEAEEQARYSIHQNNLNDQAYLDYLRPLADLIREFKAPPAQGLDYGCGPVPVMSHLLSARGYTLERFDPYFEPYTEVLEKKYDFIVASEVVEQFYNPYEEFKKLRSMLKPHGALGLMTSLFESPIEFADWHYRRDPTHVCFFSTSTLDWIKSHFAFDQLKIVRPRTILLSLET